MKLQRYTEGALGDDRREFAAYLRRLADAVEGGDARGTDVEVEVGRRGHTDDYRQISSWNGDSGYVRSVAGEEMHTIHVASLRSIVVMRCRRCGAMHEVGSCPIDRAAELDARAARPYSEPEPKSENKPEPGFGNQSEAAARNGGW